MVWWYVHTYSEICAAAVGNTSFIWWPFCSRLVKFVTNNTGNLFTLPTAVNRTGMWRYILPALHTTVNQLWEIPSTPDGRTCSLVAKLAVGSYSGFTHSLWNQLLLNHTFHGFLSISKQMLGHYLKIWCKCFLHIPPNSSFIIQ